MKKAMLFLALSAGALGACDEYPTQPEAISVESSAALTAAVAESPRHVVTFNGDESAVAAKVAELGGKVDFVSTTAGFAGVSGLSAEAVALLTKSAGVSDVFEDIIISVNGQSEIGTTEAVPLSGMSVSNPAAATLHRLQWNMRAINAPAAWAAGELGSPDVTVAILDSGIDYDGYDMVDVIDLDRSVSFVPTDDALVNAFFPGRHVIDDLNGHGTNVATQVSSGGVLFAGVNSKVRLIGVKVLSVNNTGSLAAVLAGLVYAANADADVANMSLGAQFGLSKSLTPGFINLGNKAFNYANSKGMVVVVSAGNAALNMDRGGNTFVPWCEGPHVVCVSAVGPSAGANPFSGPWTDPDAPATYSNIGREAITVSAPGGSPFAFVSSQCAKHSMTFLPNGTFVTPCNAPPGLFAVRGYVGTSHATAHVSGVVAKLVEKHGRNNPAQVRQALINSVDDLGPKGKDAVYGYGRINVAKAVGL